MPPKNAQYKGVVVDRPKALYQVKKLAVNDEKGTCIFCDVKEYDKVEMIVEKPKYAIEGVHKGMAGCVISSYAIKNEWLIVFSEEGTGKDIAELCVAREDFKVIE